MTYLNNLYELTNSHTFDDGTFKAYQDLGWSLVARATSDRGVDKLILELAEQLASNLKPFSAWNPNSGRAMEKLWTGLRPPTADSMDRLQMCLDIEILADRFDALKWHSGASLHELEVLRASLLAINASLKEQEHPNVITLEKIKKVLEDMEKQPYLLEGESEPYFRSQFEVLAQTRVLETNDCLASGQGMLDSLAGKPTKASMALGSPSFGWEALSQVFPLVAHSHEKRDLPAIRHVLLPSALNKLSKLDEVPLRALNLLIHETELFSQTAAATCGNFGNDPTPQLQQKLRNIRSMTARVLESSEENIDINTYAPLIANLSARLAGRSALEESMSSQTQSALLKCSMDICTPSRPETGLSKSDNLMRLAGEWIQYFAGLLLLYVPDRPSDPVIPLLLKREHHKKHKLEIQNKLAALQTFEKTFSGQDSNYRIHLLQDELDHLGIEPTIPSIHRPATSKLGLLQGEFNNILNSIVLRLPNPFTLKVTAPGSADLKQDLHLLRVNVAEVITRLSMNFRAYDDIVKPVIAMLTGLDIGLSLAVIAGKQSSSVEKAIAHICEMTPFLGGRPSLIANHTFKDLENNQLKGIDPRSRFLQGLALLRGVGYKGLERSNADHA